MLRTFAFCEKVKMVFPNFCSQVKNVFITFPSCVCFFIYFINIF
ncbi:hypothetical protein RUMOBE_01813 [Blautia obeum ATCC 29174]|uniref:Uncharacterized protein n=1 Tax=Blautia obeum ATCC 29174 TaxID=411459 RepID=A5ZS34_9FIRM|nr:hypothetical protein RUMOBE_01813 [Blautia obeum ATCC 29174]